MSRKPHRGSRSIVARHAHLAPWALGVIVVAAVLLIRVVGDQRLSVAPPASEPLAGLDPIEAYRHAIALQKDMRSYESLPFFRRALTGRAGDWRLRINYGVALHEATLQSHVIAGLGVPVTRNSLERVALLRESLAQLAEAERLAPHPGERAFAIASRAHRLVTWGFPLEAREEFRRAAALDPQWNEVLTLLDRRLADPTRPDSLGP